MTRPECTLDGCDRPHYGRGYCRPHYMRWKRHGDPQAGVLIVHRTPGGVNYWSALRRVRCERGPASAQRCTECGAAAANWSYDGTDPDGRTEPTRGYRFSLDPDRYRPRCRSCHRRATSPGRGPRGAVVALDVERAARLYRGGATSRGIGALLHVSPGAVRAALRAHDVTIRPRARQRTPASRTRAPPATHDPPRPERARQTRDPPTDDSERDTSEPDTSHPSSTRPAEHPTQDRQIRTKSKNQSATAKDEEQDQKQGPRATAKDEEQEHTPVQGQSGPLHHDPPVGSASPDGPAEPKGPRSC